MTGPEDQQGPGLKPWVLPLAIASVAVIVLGVLATYIDTTMGALIVLVGLLGVGWVAREAARSAGP